MDEQKILSFFQKLKTYFILIGVPEVPIGHPSLLHEYLLVEAGGSGDALI